MKVNGGTSVTYTYDANSRLTEVSSQSSVVSIQYDALGRRTSLTYPNGVTTNYTYDQASRLTEILHQGPSGIIDDLLYTYDSAGNRISFTRSGPQAPLPEPVQAAYNAANQLTNWNSNTPNLTYDNSGNLTSKEPRLKSGL